MASLVKTHRKQFFPLKTHRMNAFSCAIKKVVVGTLLITQITACGTLLYPERRGQAGGQLDVGVVALNAIGLLFFFVPGVVAFGVDFITGTIYLPGGGVASLSEDELTRIKKSSDSIDVEAFKVVMSERNDINLPNNIYTDELTVLTMSTPQSLKTAMNFSNEKIAFK